MRLIFNKDNKLEFDLQDLFDNIPEQTKLELVESLACQEVVIKHVVDQLLDGWTENMYCGASGVISEKPYTALDKGTREIAKRSGEVAAKQIEQLEQELARQHELTEEYSNKYWELYHKQRGTAYEH